MTDICSCSSFVAIFQTNVENVSQLYMTSNRMLFTSAQGVSVSENENHASLQVKSSLSFSFKAIPTFWFNTALKVLHFYKKITEKYLIMRFSCSAWQISSHISFIVKTQKERLTKSGHKVLYSGVFSVVYKNADFHIFPYWCFLVNKSFIIALSQWITFRFRSPCFCQVLCQVSQMSHLKRNVSENNL